MIEKALKSVFSIVSNEAANNRVFAKKIEDALLETSKEIQKKRDVEAQIVQFNPNVLFKEKGEDGLKRALKSKSVAALKQIVQRHNVDPSKQLGSRPTKASLVEAIIKSAEKRAQRDAKLFDY